MTITLSQEQQAWIEAQVAKGDFASTEAAVRQLIDESIAGRTSLESQLLNDDLGWAKPLVDDALGELDASKVMTLEAFHERSKARFARLIENG